MMDGSFIALIWSDRAHEWMGDNYPGVWWISRP